MADMAKKKLGRPRLEYLMPIIEVTNVAMHLSHRVDDRRSAYLSCGDAWLQVRGTADEPIEGQSDVEISVHEVDGVKGPAQDMTKSIGTLVQLKPHPHVVLDMPPKMFDRAWTMAAGGQIRYIWLSMTKSKGRYAAIVSVSIQNEPIE